MGRGGLSPRYPCPAPGTGRRAASTAPKSPATSPFRRWRSRPGSPAGVALRGLDSQCVPLEHQTCKPPPIIHPGLYYLTTRSQSGASGILGDILLGKTVQTQRRTQQKGHFFTNICICTFLTLCFRFITPGNFLQTSQ